MARKSGQRMPKVLDDDDKVVVRLHAGLVTRKLVNVVLINLDYQWPLGGLNAALAHLYSDCAIVVYTSVKLNFEALYKDDRCHELRMYQAQVSFVDNLHVQGAKWEKALLAEAQRMERAVVFRALFDGDTGRPVY